MIRMGVIGVVAFILSMVFIVLFFGLYAVSLGQSGLALAIAALATGVLINPIRLYVQNMGKKLRPKSPEDHSGRRVGAYRLVDLIDSGGMGAVWRGQHATSGRIAAIKIIPAQSGDQSGMRFERETRIVASLHHPHIVALYDAGQADGSLYMVMEFIEGESLAARLKRGTVPFEATLQLIGQIAAALDYAHEKGVIHRDVKPSNIMIRRTGEAVLMDFGVARLVGDSDLTKAGGIVGTLHYMSPEQISGTMPVDGRADIYALGVVAFEMLTGQLPFTGDNPGIVLMGHLQGPIPDPRALRPDLPASVTPAIVRALAKQPGGRFARASAFVAALDPGSQPASEIGKISGRSE